MKPGKKTLATEFQLPHGGVGEAALRRRIQRQKIAGTIRVGLADIADGGCKSERQMRDIIHGLTSINSGFNIAAINGLDGEIFRDTDVMPAADWPDSYVPWTVQSSLDAGRVEYDTKVGKLRSKARKQRK